MNSQGRAARSEYWWFYLFTILVSFVIGFAEAALGAQVEVPTFDGPTVKVKIAPGTPSGKVLRLKGRGVKTAKATGDLLVTTQIVVPQKLDKKAKEAIEMFQAATADGDVRAELIAAAKG